MISRVAPGRGAWLCSGSLSCLDLAVRRNAMSRALHVPIAASQVAALSAEMQAQ